MNGTPPPLPCILALQPCIMSGIFLKVLLILKSVTIHSIASGRGPGMWAQQKQRSPGRIVSGARSLKSPGKRGGADFSPRLRQRAFQDFLTRQGGDALKAGVSIYLSIYLFDMTPK
jgi:hypothetical protein